MARILILVIFLYWLLIWLYTNRAFAIEIRELQTADVFPCKSYNLVTVPRHAFTII